MKHLNFTSIWPSICLSLCPFIHPSSLHLAVTSFPVDIPVLSKIYISPQLLAYFHSKLIANICQCTWNYYLLSLQFVIITFCLFVITMLLLPFINIIIVCSQYNKSVSIKWPVIRIIPFPRDSWHTTVDDTQFENSYKIIMLGEWELFTVSVLPTVFMYWLVFAYIGRIVEFNL